MIDEKGVQNMQDALTSAKPAQIRKRQLQPVIIIATLALLCALFGILNPNFISPSNLFSILLASVMVGMMAVGESMCIIAGYFDMSVGMVASLSALALAYTLTGTHSLLLALLLGVLVAAACGLLAGLLVSYLRLNAFITTFALQSIYRGIIYILTNGLPIPLMGEEFSAFTSIGQYKLFGAIQFPIIAMLLVYVMAALFMKYRRLGRSIYLVGGNPKCAQISGISLHKIHLLVFVVCDVLAGLAGILYASRMATAQPFLSETIAMEAIAASVVGGVSMMGGKGNIAMTFLGVLIIYIVKNGLTMVGMPDFYQYIATGLILYVAVLAQMTRKEK